MHQNLVIEPTLDCVLDQLLASDQSKQSIKALSKLLQGLITVAGPELEMDKVRFEMVIRIDSL